VKTDMRGTETSTALRVVSLEKRFRRERGQGIAAVDNVSLEIAPGSMVAVLGPSGSGKTTLLRCIAGLETPTGGEIWKGSQLLSSGEKGIVVPPEKRQFGMMFQSYAVWPHMTVFANVAYPLKVRRFSKSRIEESVTNMLGVVGIAHLRDEYPSTLSGGQQQRVALARCLVRDPALILFDEPLSNVDAKVREELRVELLSMHKRLGFAGVYVTHDQEEAMVISDRIVVMNDGRVVQDGTPQEIYRRPTSRFVANFIGIANMWEGSVRGPGDSSDAMTVTTDVGDIRVASENVPEPLRADGQRVVVMARPEALSVSAARPDEASDHNVLRGVLRAEMFRGSHSEFLVEVGDQTVRIRASRNHGIAEGATVFVLAAAHALRVLPRSERSGEEGSAVVGQPGRSDPTPTPVNAGSSEGKNDRRMGNSSRLTLREQPNYTEGGRS
jgi:iron(III) transport system ATP-binding protein